MHLDKLLKLGLLSFLIFSYLESFSQNDFQEGYVITNNRDTLYGYIDYRSNTKNYKSCRFRKDGKIIEYSPNELIGFRFQNDKFFTSSVIINTFVEAVVEGELSLFKAKDKYILKKGNQINELTSQFADGKPGQKNNKWRGIVAYLISDCAGINNNINTLKLSERSLSMLTIQYNQCKNTQSLIYKENIPWLNLDVGAFIGLTKSTISISDRTGEFEYFAKSYSSIDPSGGLSFNITSPRISRKLSFLSGVYFTQSNYSSFIELKRPSNDQFHDVFIEISTVSTPFLLQYTMFNNPFQVYFQGGFNFDFNIEAKTTLLTETITSNVVSTANETVAFDINKEQVGVVSEIGVLKSFKKFRSGVGIRYVQMKRLNQTGGFIANNSRLAMNLVFVIK